MIMKICSIIKNNFKLGDNVNVKIPITNTKR